MLLYFNATNHLQVFGKIFFLKFELNSFQRLLYKRERSLIFLEVVLRADKIVCFDFFDI